MTYSDATEAAGLARDTVIRQWHPELKRADIAYCFVDQIRSKGVEVWADIRVSSALIKHLSGHEIIVRINEGVWKHQTDAWKLALLDHEFCHVSWDEEKTRWITLPHDLEEFNRVVKRHGLWRSSIRLFKMQTDLFTDSEGDEVGEEDEGNGMSVTFTPELDEGTTVTITAAEESVLLPAGDTA